jgi:hypothetical protein
MTEPMANVLNDGDVVVLQVASSTGEFYQVCKSSGCLAHIIVLCPSHAHAHSIALLQCFLRACVCVCVCVCVSVCVCVRARA